MAVPTQTVVSGTADINSSTYSYCGGIWVSATDASVVNLRDTDDSGTILAQLRVPADATDGIIWNDPIFAPGGFYVDYVSGTTPQINAKMG